MGPYYANLVGAGKSKKPHPTIELAREAAIKLYHASGCKRDVSILETVEVIKAPKVDK